MHVRFCRRPRGLCDSRVPLVPVAALRGGEKGAGSTRGDVYPYPDPVHPPNRSHRRCQAKVRGFWQAPWGGGPATGVMRRSRPRPRERRWTLRTTGVRPPKRVGWKALLDLDTVERECVVWLLRRLEAGEYIGSHALARECGIRTSTATAFLQSSWVDWARRVLRPGTSLAVSQPLNPNDLARLGAALREQLGTSASDPQLAASLEGCTAIGADSGTV
jgi:hypothetical protein